ncbi:histidine kinase [Natronolimnobius sp. AArcel1]|uniref:DICT sensory domain-containing protein n=1 Tax=Natronolimnobius sp. AArcel1 TaxID=1679093 RepID=UPI0013EB5394|nr:DICT sensory domain-containing protein [Natronolimnobius sp. AArcel1]NGM71500.1 histidine kinase [Natronolimnobius sp. AArcel1]
MKTLRAVFDSVRAQQKQLEVYTPDTETAGDLEQQFSTRHVDVVRRSLTEQDGPGFVVIRDQSGDFLAAVGLDRFEALFAPDDHPPWEFDGSTEELRDLFDFLENTFFSSADRQQMLAAAREIEERAWRTGEGTLYTGFQTEPALTAQTDVYDQLGVRNGLSVVAFVRDKWSGSLENVTVVTDPAEELGSFWFVVFDGGGHNNQQCALLAEERDMDSFYGCWTYEPDIVAELVAYLESTYCRE